jgi:hypothetical protein
MVFIVIPFHVCFCSILFLYFGFQYLRLACFGLFLSFILHTCSGMLHVLLDQPSSRIILIQKKYIWWWDKTLTRKEVSLKLNTLTSLLSHTNSNIYVGIYRTLIGTCTTHIMITPNMCTILIQTLNQIQRLGNWECIQDV